MFIPLPPNEIIDMVKNGTSGIVDIRIDLPTPIDLIEAVKKTLPDIRIPPKISFLFAVDDLKIVIRGIRRRLQEFLKKGLV
jgi:hypothetical protein